MEMPSVVHVKATTTQTSRFDPASHMLMHSYPWVNTHASDSENDHHKYNNDPNDIDDHNYNYDYIARNSDTKYRNNSAGRLPGTWFSSTQGDVTQPSYCTRDQVLVLFSYIITQYVDAQHLFGASPPRVFKHRVT